MTYNCERSEQKILDNSKQKQEFTSQATYPLADMGPPNNLQNCKRFTMNFMPANTLKLPPLFWSFFAYFNFPPYFDHDASCIMLNIEWTPLATKICQIGRASCRERVSVLV